MPAWDICSGQQYGSEEPVTGKTDRERKQRMKKLQKIWGNVKKHAMQREQGIDGILVTVGLCIIALLLCVVMKDSLTSFIQTIVSAMQTKAADILTGV